MTVTEVFAEWSLQLDVDDLPASVTQAAAAHLLDGLGCALAALTTGAGAPAAAAASAFGVGNEATIIGSSSQVPALAAALANGALVHALDFDDTHTEALVHATAAVLPAAFAAGEEHSSTGAEVLAACVAGYTMAIRLGSAVRHGFHARGFHATSVVGVFAGALAAARLAGLTKDQTTNALGIAGSLASGSLEFLSTGSSTKSLHPGLSGMNSLLAVRLAAEGADGPSTIIEGEHGLFASFTGASVDADALIADLHAATREIARIAIKPYPACQLSVASLDALKAAMHGVDVNDVTSIAFDVPQGVASIVCDPIEIKRAPRSSYEAKFSLPWCAAALAIDGGLTLGSFGPWMLERLDALTLAQRIEHRVIDLDVAPADAPGVVTVTLKDGSVRAGRSERDNDALDLDRVLEKFHQNAGGRTDQTERLAEDVLGLGQIASLGPIFQKARR